MAVETALEVGGGAWGWGRALAQGRAAAGKGTSKGGFFFHGQLMASDLGRVRTNNYIKYSLRASYFKAFSRTLSYLVFMVTLRGWAREAWRVHWGFLSRVRARNLDLLWKPVSSPLCRIVICCDKVKNVAVVRVLT